MNKKDVETPETGQDKREINEQENTQQTAGQPNESIENPAPEDQDQPETPESGTDLTSELEKERDKFLRLFAEFENYKKRTTRERIELFRTAGQEVIQALLPVLDDFERALAQMRRAGADQWLEGVELISNKFQDVLRQKGLEAIEVKVGDAFDSDLHEAVTQVPAPEESLKGKVIDVVETGYRLGDKTIRHPKVVVGQ